MMHFLTPVHEQAVLIAYTSSGLALILIISDYRHIIVDNLISLRFNRCVVSRAPSLGNYRIFSCYPLKNKQNFFLFLYYRLYNIIVFHSLSIVFLNIFYEINESIYSS